jgi:hypothetical protein
VVGRERVRPNLELDMVASRPNVGLAVDASRSKIELDAVASRPNVRLSVDASRSNMLLPSKKNHIVDLKDKIKNYYYYYYLCHKYYHFYYT